MKSKDWAGNKNSVFKTLGASNHYIKSAFPYMGGKYKLLPQIIPIFPENIRIFVDLFGGGFNVGVNVNAETIVYNDTCKQVVELLQNFYINKTESIHKAILNTIRDFGLSRSDIHNYEYYGCNSSEGLGKYNKEKYLKLREAYNHNPDWIKFYTLITCSFSNQIRFNSKGQFNLPYGERDYNLSLQAKLKDFCDLMHTKNIKFTSMDFTQLKVEKLTSKDFVYLDPPYLGSLATYNEQKGWSETEEGALLKLCDELTEHKVRLALSNNLKYENNMLKNWLEENKEKYTIHYLGSQYTNCNYHKKDKSKDAEVLITNY